MQNVIVDNNVKQTDAIEVAVKNEREYRAEQKHLSQKIMEE